MFNELIEKYPNLYKKENSRYCMQLFGFEVEDGWFKILKDFSEKANTALEKNPDPEFFITQIKQKYGTLRIYTSFCHDEIDKLIEEAELKANVTCEICGKEGKAESPKGWIYVLCEEHKEELKNAGRSRS